MTWNSQIPAATMSSLCPSQTFGLAMSPLTALHTKAEATDPTDAVRATQLAARNHWLELASTREPTHTTDLRPRSWFEDADWTSTITCDLGFRGGCRNLVKNVVNGWLWTLSSNYRKTVVVKQKMCISFSKRCNEIFARENSRASDTTLLASYDLLPIC